MSRFLSLLVMAAPACLPTSSQDPGGGEDFTTPDMITIGSGDRQVARVGAPFSDPLFVQVWTPDELKCNGCRVVWDLIPGGFDGGPVQTRSSVIGQAGLQITGIGTAGTYRVTATIDNGDSVTFTLTAQ